MPKRLKEGSIKRADALLLYRLFHHFGGPTKVAKILEAKLPDERISKQLVALWMKRGSIPIVRAIRVAKALKVSPFTLNYVQLSQVSAKYPPWSKIVREADFLSKDDKKMLLTMKEPK